MVKLIRAGETAAQWGYKSSPPCLLSKMLSSQVVRLLYRSFWDPINCEHISLAVERARREMQQEEGQGEVCAGGSEKERGLGKVVSFLGLF